MSKAHHKDIFATNRHGQFDSIPIATDLEDLHVVLHTRQDVFGVRTETLVQTIIAEDRDFKEARLLFDTQSKDGIDDINIHGSANAI